MSDSTATANHENENTNYIKDEVHYYEDGNVIFIVGTTLFRVYQKLLARRSTVMNDMFALPQPGTTSFTAQLHIDGVPAITLHDDVTHFRLLLDYILPQHMPPKNLGPILPLLNLANISQKYGIDDVTPWIVVQLEYVLPTSSLLGFSTLSVYKDLVTPHAIIKTRGMEKYYPVAFYILATVDWATAPASFVSTLQVAEMQRFMAGYQALQRELLTRLQEWETLDTSYSCLTCVNSDERYRPNYVAGRSALLAHPLEELRRRSSSKKGNLCVRCFERFKTCNWSMMDDLFRDLKQIFYP